MLNIYSNVQWMPLILMAVGAATICLALAAVLFADFSTRGARAREFGSVDALAWIGLSMAFPQGMMLLFLWGYAADGFLVGAVGIPSVGVLWFVTYVAARNELRWMRGEQPRGRGWRSMLLTQAALAVPFAALVAFAFIDPEQTPKNLEEVIRAAVAVGVSAIAGILLTLPMRSSREEASDAD